MVALQRDAFLREVVERTPDGQRLLGCLQCGTCAGSCPNSSDMDITPRQVLALILAGEREAALRSRMIWHCVSCYACMQRCPKKIPITEIVYTLKQMAIRARLAAETDGPRLAETFAGFVERYGRSFEFGLATRYYLLSRPGDLLRKGPLGLRMIRHGRLTLRPKHIRGVEQLRQIMQRAEALGAMS